MNLKKFQKYFPIVLSLVLVAVIAAPYLVHGAGLVIEKPGDLPGNETTPKLLIVKIINIMLAIAGILAVLFIIIGGFQYIVSGANEEWAESGKKTLKNAIIGLVIIILSYVIVNVINNAIG